MVCFNKQKVIFFFHTFHSVKNTPKIAIFRMCYGENATVNFFETLADNVFRQLFHAANLKKIE